MIAFRPAPGLEGGVAEPGNHGESGKKQQEQDEV
jgi:hypothetical protein